MLGDAIDRKDSTKKWYAIYTRSRSEKKVYCRLMESGVESFLPLYKTMRQWSDRKKLVEMPLLNSYVFTKLAIPSYELILQTEGAVKFVSFEGMPVPIPQKQIDNLILLINSRAEIEKTSRNFKPGQKVIVTLGPLKGLTGELVRTGNQNRFLMRIEHIRQNLLVNIPIDLLAKDTTTAG
jgi:transcription antitermination factor NusG